uniref:39S ribosomal protein L41, mitochondrial n=1 Tax=Hemiselmis andersenii TaxID=464988 RepID=A0A6U5CEV9_HEMAN|mmetsp:Transcript_12207/g.28554  ORF Transcript_12207/g.28554 Transcript_12207/m.28554 type:complete len:109 (+) Transcript_12207:99-425(+)
MWGFGSRRPVASAMSSLVDAMRGKFGNRQGQSMGRFPLTGKRGPRNFYKGKGAPSMGKLTSKGAFVLQRWKIPQLIVPDLTDTDLKPYVAIRWSSSPEPPAEKKEESQ